MYKAILVISDNQAIVKEFINILKSNSDVGKDRTFNFACHISNKLMSGLKIDGHTIKPLDIKKDFQLIINSYDLVISAHCKQIFPDELVNKVKCINIHPGYNPYNRGWYPQVFSILNGKPLGATIHEIDEQLDHGGIIDRELVEVKRSDTSLTAYNRVQQAEFRLMEKNLKSILDNTYKVSSPEEEGNINFRKDFFALQEINLDEAITFSKAIDRLRALSHPPYKNAYFIDPNNGKRVWIKITLEEDAD
jgi:methionyl-tRNA formyltransferase